MRERHYPGQVLRLKAFGFPVNIHLTFLIVLLFVIDSGLSGIGIALWTLAIFLSVVLHELGHAAAVRRFRGHVDAITIYALGGVTVWRELDVPIRGWRRFVVAAAGSGVGLFAGLGLYLFVAVGGLGARGALFIPSPWSRDFFFADLRGEYLIFFAGGFIWVSVVWGLVNWVPIGGLDGSRMLREILIKVLGPKGDLHARIIGVVFAFAAAYWFWQRGSTFVALILIMFAVTDLSGYRARRPPPGLHEPGARADVDHEAATLDEEAD